jgi:EAL and modified HD-GYP domain-containing signal transduction protein
LKAALIRGRMMELLAPQCTPPLSADDAFIVGVFSLLDKLMGVSIDEALKGIQLPREVLDAITQEGSLGNLLFSVEACEMPDSAVMVTYEYDLGIEGLLPAAHLKAMQWAESISGI